MRGVGTSNKLDVTGYSVDYENKVFSEKEVWNYTPLAISSGVSEDR